MAMLVPCAFAEEYDLSAGEIKVFGDGTGTYVAQGSHNTDDDVQGGSITYETISTVTGQSNSDP